MNNECGKCFREMTEGEQVFELNDEMVCESCFQDAEAQAEYLWADQMESAATGN